EIAEGLRALSREEGTTLFMTLLAAFQALLSRYTGQEDVVVGTPVANRVSEEVEELIGFFVNTLALRTDLSGEPTFKELVRRVREVALGAYAHQDVPFEKLVEELQPERDLSRNPLFQVMFILQNASDQRLELPGLRLSPYQSSSAASQFDMTMIVAETAQGFVAALEYQADLFDDASIRRMLSHFSILLKVITTDPGARLSDLPLLSDEESHLILTVWNDTRADFPGPLCLHQLFEAQAERTPDRVAVSFDEQHLTYAELNERADWLAHRLNVLGVGPET